MGLGREEQARAGALTGHAWHDMRAEEGALRWRRHHEATRGGRPASSRAARASARVGVRARVGPT